MERITNIAVGSIMTVGNGFFAAKMYDLKLETISKIDFDIMDIQKSKRHLIRVGANVVLRKGEMTGDFSKRIFYEVFFLDCLQDGSNQ